VISVIPDADFTCSERSLVFFFNVSQASSSSSFLIYSECLLLFIFIKEEHGMFIAIYILIDSCKGL